MLALLGDMSVTYLWARSERRGAAFECVDLTLAASSRGWNMCLPRASREGIRFFIPLPKKLSEFENAFEKSPLPAKTDTGKHERNGIFSGGKFSR